MAEWKAVGMPLGLMKGDHLGYAALFQSGGVGVFGTEGPSTGWRSYAVDVFAFDPPVVVTEPQLCDVFLDPDSQSARLEPFVRSA